MAIDPVTPESIARAQAAQAREREQVYQETGVRIPGDGTIARPIRQVVRVRISAYRRVMKEGSYDYTR